VDFIDKLRALSVAIPKQLEHLATEEATKQALVMPFIAALGYNVFDPTEIVPELTADVGIKKGEKVDYAILCLGKPMILFECKWHGTDLDREHASQLYRYFGVTAARFGVLTNGIVYRFFTDLDDPNKMDSKPFLEFNVLTFTDNQVEELKRFTKSGFVLEEALTAAGELKYTKEIKRILSEQLAAPTEEFVRFFATQVYGGKLTQNVKTQFTALTKRALQQFISERIGERLKSAMDQEAKETPPTLQPAAPPEPAVVTTEEEREAYLIVKSIVREVIDPRRLAIRDAQSYCAVLIDDNNRKPLCRFYFGSKKKSVTIFGENKQEENVAITDLNDLFALAPRLKVCAALYATPTSKAGAV